MSSLRYFHTGRISFLGVCIFYSILFLSSCTNEIIELPEPVKKDTTDTNNTVISHCDSLNVTWTATILPIINANCAVSGCHVSGGAGNGVFSSYDAVKAKVDNGTFRQRVIVTKDMPPGGPLSAADIDKITCWLDAGAPNN